MRNRLAAVAALLTLLWLPYAASPAPVRAASVCTSWDNARIPPSTIRVLRTRGPSDGHVVTVDFKDYVKTVLSAEWPPSYPTQALRAGAVAVKQYAWYYILHYRGGTKRGSCYDVVDNTNDQIYRPESHTPTSAHIVAVESTWGTMITKNNAFVLTGYRSGAFVACGTDSDGWHMFQHSARDCAAHGYTYQQILHTYFDPGVVVWDAPTYPTTLFYSPPTGTQSILRDSVTASWDELASNDLGIQSRLVTLQMSQPINDVCRSDRWLPSIPPWQSTEASPQTVTGLKGGYCYRFVVKLTDSAGTKYSQSGTFRVDPRAPMATFTTPPSNAVTTLPGTSYTVKWTEATTNGAKITSRKLIAEYGGQPVEGSCATARYTQLKILSLTAPSGTITGLEPLNCYRFRVQLMDSANHFGSWTSGVLMVPRAIIS